MKCIYYNVIFTGNTYAFTLDTSEVDQGMVIGQVRARDADEGTNGLIRYRIRNSDSLENPQSPSNFFGIDAATGQIRIKKLPLTKRK